MFSDLKDIYRRNAIRFDTNVCSYCSQPGQPSNPLNYYCGCPVRSHLNCLIRHIQYARQNDCEFCYTPFKNVRIIYPSRTLSDWLREDSSSRDLLIRILTLILLLVYLDYLSLLQMAVQYQIMYSFEKYVLEFLIYCLYYFIVSIFVFTFIFMIGSYYNFRQTTGHVNVIPLNPTFSDTTSLTSSQNLNYFNPKN